MVLLNVVDFHINSPSCKKVVHVRIFGCHFTANILSLEYLTEYKDILFLIR